MPYKGIFELEFEINIAVFEHSALEICLIAKFREK